MLLANGSFVYIRGQDPCSQMKHETGWKQRNHPCSGLDSFQRCKDRRRSYHIKDGLAICRKGCCLMHPSCYSCCHEIDRYWNKPEVHGMNFWLRLCRKQWVGYTDNREEGQKHITVPTCCLHVHQKMRKLCLLLRDTAEITAVFCPLELQSLSGTYSGRTYDQKGAFSIRKL